MSLFPVTALFVLPLLLYEHRKFDHYQRTRLTHLQLRSAYGLVRFNFKAMSG